MQTTSRTYFGHPKGLPDPSNTSVAYNHMDNRALKRALFLFQLMGRRRLMRFLRGITLWSLRLRLPVAIIIKPLVFKHFCGGATLPDVLPDVAKLHHYGVGSIPDFSVEGKADDTAFNRVCEEVLATLQLAATTPGITHAVFKPSGIGPFKLWERLSEGSTLHEADQQALKRLNDRLELIFGTAHSLGVPVMVDAEETWIQHAIDEMIRKYSARFNRERVIIYNTLQMYRTDRLGFLKQELETARTEGYLLGYKLVRGAYHEQEIQRAREKGYPSPVFTQKEMTDASFDEAACLCFEHRQWISLCAATHNEQSTMRLAKQILSNDRQSGLPITFAQLYGMGDHLTFNLAAAGFSASKYLPYGPVKEVIPYLLRRAEENSSVAGQTGRELTNLRKEWKRRRG
jgi:proline dehydrogenase